MSRACTSVWWAWSLRFRGYGYLSKMAKFPFGAWTIVHGHIDRNRLKKFMQVGVNVTCMYTSFGGCGLSVFGDIATLKFDQMFPFNHGLMSSACTPVLVGVVSW